MTDFAFDPGSSGDTGPWLSWRANATPDGRFPPHSWLVRSGEERTLADLTKGVVFDWISAKTGWQERGNAVKGVAPKKGWNASIGKFEPRPGDNYGRLLHIPVALSATERVVWEQDALGAWLGFVDLMGLLREPAPLRLPDLPLIACVGQQAMKLGAGTTVKPKFQIMRFVPRPPCLPESPASGNGGGDDAWGKDPSPPSTRTPPLADPWGATVHADGFTPLPNGSDDLDEEVPF